MGFVPLEEVEATAYFARAKARAKFPPLPMYVERRREVIDHWVVTIRMPGDGRKYQMGVLHHEVEIDAKYEGISPLTFLFERLKREVVEVLAALTLKQHGYVPN